MNLCLYVKQFNFSYRSKINNIVNYFLNMMVYNLILKDFLQKSVFIQITK